MPASSEPTTVATATFPNLIMNTPPPHPRAWQVRAPRLPGGPGPWSRYISPVPGRTGASGFGHGNGPCRAAPLRILNCDVTCECDMPVAVRGTLLRRPRAQASWYLHGHAERMHDGTQDAATDAGLRHGSSADRIDIQVLHALWFVW